MMNACECGARRYGIWEECTCSLDKCTFEFRLFNTTSNPKKLHAYLALTQALVAKAIQIDEIRNADDFPALGFVDSTYKNFGAGLKTTMHEKWTSRMNWIMNELPLTDEEKDSIMYVVDNSELAVIRDAITTERGN
jgi:hypothetical protein